MKQILVGVDGSKEARDAVKLAEEIARATGSQLIIACAVPPVLPTEIAPELMAQAEKWQRKEREQAKATVQEIAASIGQAFPSRRWCSTGPRRSRSPSWRVRTRWSWWWSAIAAATRSRAPCSAASPIDWCRSARGPCWWSVSGTAPKSALRGIRRETKGASQ